MSDDNHKEEKAMLAERDSFTQVQDFNPQGQRTPIEGRQASKVAAEYLGLANTDG